MTYSPEIILAFSRCLSALHLAPNFKEGVRALLPCLEKIFTCRYAMVDELSDEGVQVIHANATFGEPMTSPETLGFRSDRATSVIPWDTAQNSQLRSVSIKPITISVKDEAVFHTQLFEQAASQDRPGLALRARSSGLGITLLRASPFKTEELFMAGLVLQQMDSVLHRGNKTPSSVRSEAQNACSIRVTRRGHCLETLSSCAEKLLSRHLDTTSIPRQNELPRELVAWICSHDRQAPKPTCQSDERKIKTFPSPRGELCAEISSTEVPNQFFVRLWERSDQCDWLQLKQLGLTPRECEAVYWLNQGKRDSEIAVILDVSARTVGKHVEHILKKVNAESRFIAARTAEDYLRRRACA